RWQLAWRERWAQPRNRYKPSRRALRKEELENASWEAQNQKTAVPIRLQGTLESFQPPAKRSAQHSEECGLQQCYRQVPRRDANCDPLLNCTPTLNGHPGRSEGPAFPRDRHKAFASGNYFGDEPTECLLYCPSSLLTLLASFTPLRPFTYFAIPR